MEVLQLEQIEIAPARQPIVELSKGYLERIKDRLSRIPTTPSLISIPSSSSTADSNETLSSIAPTVTTTVPTTEPSIVSTSLLSIPEVFVVQKLYVSPSMPIEDTILCLWNRQIRSRLTAILLHEIPTGTCVQEFMGVGKKSTNLIPTLVISCGNNSTKKKVEKVFKKQVWLQDILKENRVMFVALVTKTYLSAGPAIIPKNAIEISQSCSVELPTEQIATACGALLCINTSRSVPEKHCTLGGLIMINGKIFGLTAGHPFKKRLNIESPHYILDSVSLESIQDDEDSDVSDEPFVFNGGNNTPPESLSRSSTSSQSLNIQSSGSVEEDTHTVNRTYSLVPDSVHWSYPFDVIVPPDKTTSGTLLDILVGDQDWALLRDLPRKITSLANKISHIDARHDIWVEDTTSGMINGEVTVTVGGFGAQLGQLQPSSATMIVDGLSLNVQMITLERVLPLGSSGAWVVHDRKLCGFIVAVRQDVPWAYMAPIEPIFEDIKDKLGTRDVRLPTRNEVGPRRLSFLKPTTVMSLLAASDDIERSQPSTLQSSDTGRLGSSYSSLLPLLRRSRGSPQTQGATDHSSIDLHNADISLEDDNANQPRPQTNLWSSEASATSTFVDTWTAPTPNEISVQALNWRTSDREWTPVVSEKEHQSSRPGWTGLFEPKKRKKCPGDTDDPFNDLELGSSLKLCGDRPSRAVQVAKSFNLFLRHLSRWLCTVALCSLYIVVVVIIQKRHGVSALSRRSFGVVTVGTSIALSFNIASSLKAMTSDLRWRVLSHREHEDTILTDLEHLLDIGSWRNLLFLALPGDRRSRRPMFLLALLLWCLLNVSAFFGVAVLSSTYDFVPGYTIGALEVRNVTIPDMRYFYPLRLGDDLPSLQDEVFAAHTHGEYAQTLGLNYIGRIQANESEHQPSLMLSVDIDARTMGFCFADTVLDEYSQVPVSIHVERGINLTWACESHKVISGGNGSSPDIEVETLGALLVPETPPGSLAFYLRDTSNVPQYKYGNDNRSSELYVFEPSSVDPWYYNCSLSLGRTFRDPKNLSHISDQMAQIATASIASGGLPDLNQLTSQIYGSRSLWGSPLKGNADGMGLKLATFALGSIAGASLHNPTTIYEDMVPSNEMYLQVNNRYFYLTIGLICGCHFVLCFVVALLMKGVKVGPRSHLDMGILLKPATDQLSEFSRGHHQVRAAKRMWVACGRDNAGEWELKTR